MASILDEIRSKIDLVDLISQYLPLKKVGSSYRALCPFHSEKTPSFYVSPQKQIWKCFGCNRAGDHFKFIIEYEKVDFKEALKILAQKAGIELKKIPKEIRTKIDEIIEIHKIAARFFHEKLFLNQEVLDYLKKRGLKNETIEDFQIGYGAEGLFDFLVNLGFEKQIILDSGIFYEKDFEVFNRFEKRLIFPIYNLKGLIVAFSGRSLNSEEPKYVNSPDTLVFKKGEIFYGFHLALPFIKDKNQVFLVEGFFDLILAWQKGLKNVLAILGTALTPYHIKIISRLTNNLVFCFDNDEAGKNATIKSAILATMKNLNLFQAIYDKKDLGDFLIEKDIDDIKVKELLDFWLENFKEEELIEFLPQFLAATEVKRRIELLKKIKNYGKIKIEWLVEEIEKAKKSLPKIEIEKEEKVEEIKKEKISRYESLVEILISLAYGMNKKEILEEMREFLPEDLSKYESLWEIRYEYEKSVNKNLNEYLNFLISEIKKEFYRKKIEEISKSEINEEKLKEILELTKKLKELYAKKKKEK